MGSSSSVISDILLLFADEEWNQDIPRDRYQSATLE